MWRVALVEDHQLVREALVGFLEAVQNLQIVGTARGLHDGVPMLQAVAPDILLADLMLEDGSATEILEHVRRERMRVQVIVLTGLRDLFSANEALGAGAMGYVLKSQPSSELVAAIETVTSGRRYIAPAIAAQLRTSAAAPGAPRGLACLTRREAEILRMIAHGYSNMEVARCLNVSIKTLETHRCNMNRKLSLRSTVDLVRFAAAHGIGSAPIPFARKPCTHEAVPGPTGADGAA